MTPEEHQAEATRYAGMAVKCINGWEHLRVQDLISLAQVHATLANGVAAQKLDEANAALDKIAQYATPNDAPGWSDMPGLLESICNTIETTGRTINYEGDY